MAIKIISLSILAFYVVVITVLAIAIQQYWIFAFLLFWVNTLVVWLIGRTFTNLMLFPNSNMLVAYFMNQSLYKKVTQEM